MGGLVEDAGAGEVLALANGEVVGVVGGGDFHGSGAELGLGPIIGEDGDFAVGASVYTGHGDADFFDDEGGVAGVGGVYGYGGVAEHGLGAGCGYGDVGCSIGQGAVGEGVADVVELAEA